MRSQYPWPHALCRCGIARSDIDFRQHAPGGRSALPAASPDIPKPPPRTLVTSALPYANGHVHIGHLAGAYLPADIYARYLRATGSDVAFI